MARGGEELDGDVAVGDGVDAVRGDAREAELARDVRRGRAAKPVPASAPAPSGSSSARARQSREAAAVAREHLVVGEEVMREEDRLGALQVRVAGQQRVRVAARERRPARAAGRRARRPWPRTRRAARGAGRARPDRCGCGRCGACPPSGPISSIRRRSTPCGCPRPRRGSGSARVELAAHRARGRASSRAPSARVSRRCARPARARARRCPRCRGGRARGRRAARW